MTATTYRRVLSSVLALSTVVFLGAGCGGKGGGGGNGGADDGTAVDEQAMEGEALVGVRDEAFRTPGVEATIAQVGTVIGVDENGGVYQVKLNDGTTVEAAEAKISGGDVLYVEHNWMAHQYADGADPYLASQYNALVRAQLATAWTAWGTKTHGSPRAIKIAVVDDGVKGDHPDLSGKVAAGRDILNSAPTSAGADSSSGSHGTEVAGVAAANIGNSTGISGIAANSAGDAADPVAVTIVPVKVKDGTHALTHATIAAGINWVANPTVSLVTGSAGGNLVGHSRSSALTTTSYARRADIILLSLGSGAPSYTLQKAIENAWAAGCLVVAAAGNSGTALMRYPAAYHGTKQNVLSVTSVSQADKLSAGANYGSWVDVAGPGEGIITTTSGDLYTDDTQAPKVNGSSYSAAYVAGAAALVWSAYPPVAAGSEATDRLTNLQLRKLLIASVDPIDLLPKKTLGANAGRLNVQSAMANVSNLTDTSAEAAPASVVFSGASVVSGATLNGKVVLTKPALADLQVALASADPTTLSLGTTAAVTIKRGLTTGTFKVTAATGITVATPVDITATTANGSAKATITVVPPPLAVASFVLDKKSTIVWDTPGTTGYLTGTVTLTGVAQGSTFLWLRVGGSGVTLADNNGGELPSYSDDSYVFYKVTVSGAGTVSFRAQPEPVVAAVSYSVIAFVGADQNAYNASSNPGKSVTFRVNPALVSFLLQTRTVTGGASTTGTVTLAALPPTPQTLSVVLDSRVCSVPSTSKVYLTSTDTPSAACWADIIIGTGTKTGAVTIHTRAPVSTVSAALTASFLGVDKTATLTIKPPITGAGGGSP